MPWAKLDDGFDENRKVRRAWRRDPRSVGLHVMAITYCCRHLTDGFVDPEWLDEKVPGRRDLDKLTGLLVEVGLWHEHGDGWAIHDFLDYNRSAEKVEQVREARRTAGHVGGKRSRPVGRPRHDDPAALTKQLGSRGKATVKQQAATIEATGKQLASPLVANAEANDEAKSNPVPVPVPIPQVKGNSSSGERGSGRDGGSGGKGEKRDLRRVDPLAALRETALSLSNHPMAKGTP